MFDRFIDELMSRTSSFSGEMDDIWSSMKEDRLRKILARKYIKIERKRLEELARLKLSKIIYIFIEYILLIRNYRRAKGWRLSGDQ